MMEMEDILQEFPKTLHQKKAFALREYLQYEILKAIFESKHALKFTFLGGTCLHLVYGTERFSEDLDFDNEGLTEEEFEETGAIVKRWLELLGYQVDIRFIYKGAFHCNVRFPGLLYDYKMSGHKEAKLLIKLDTEKQHFEYDRELVRLRKFGVDTEIFAPPLHLLCSQKISAALGRKRAKGRDYYDLWWLLQRTSPNYEYLAQKLEISDAKTLNKRVSIRMAELDFDQLAADVAPFLFNEKDIEAVRQFPSFWKSWMLSTG